jgi:hypothetical protein
VANSQSLRVMFDSLLQGLKGAEYVKPPKSAAWAPTLRNISSRLLGREAGWLESEIHKAIGMSNSRIEARVVRAMLNPKDLETHIAQAKKILPERIAGPFPSLAGASPSAILTPGIEEMATPEGLAKRQIALGQLMYRLGHEEWPNVLKVAKSEPNPKYIPRNQTPKEKFDRLAPGVITLPKPGQQQTPTVQSILSLLRGEKPKAPEITQALPGWKEIRRDAVSGTEDRIKAALKLPTKLEGAKHLEAGPEVQRLKHLLAQRKADSQDRALGTVSASRQKTNTSGFDRETMWRNLEGYVNKEKGAKTVRADPKTGKLPARKATIVLPEVRARAKFYTDTAFETGASTHPILRKEGEAPRVMKSMGAAQKIDLTSKIPFKDRVALALKKAREGSVSGQAPGFKEKVAQAAKLAQQYPLGGPGKPSYPAYVAWLKRRRGIEAPGPEHAIAFGVTFNPKMQGK